VPHSAHDGSHLCNYSHLQGGVGKSTIAVNLAYTLAQQGGRVGLLDLDLYGPSLPVLVRPKDLTIRRSPLGKGMVYPITHEGVKLLSLGFVNRSVRNDKEKLQEMSLLLFELRYLTSLHVLSEWGSGKWRRQWSFHHERPHGCQGGYSIVRYDPITSY